MISLGLISFSQNFFGNTVNINLERLMENVIDPFWEDFIEQELIEVSKRHERVILSNLCGGGNMKFLDMCMNSFFGTCFIYPAVTKEVKNKNPYIKIYYE